MPGTGSNKSTTQFQGGVIRNAGLLHVSEEVGFSQDYCQEEQMVLILILLLQLVKKKKCLALTKN